MAAAAAAAAPVGGGGVGLVAAKADIALVDLNVVWKKRLYANEFHVVCKNRFEWNFKRKSKEKIKVNLLCNVHFFSSVFLAREYHCP